MINYNKIVQKQILLCTLGKYQLDVEDFFKELNINGYIDTCSACNQITPGGKSICHISDLQESMWNGKITVICEFYPDDTAEKLNSHGLIYGQDYIYLTDLITVVDETETYNVICNYKDKSVIVMGTGHNCQKLMLRNPHLNVTYFVDNDVSKHGSLFYNRRVLPVEEILNEQPGTYILIATPAKLPDVKAQLNGLGLKFGKDYYCYNADIHPFSPLSSKLESTFLPFMEYAPSIYLRKVISECRQFESECDVTILPIAIGYKGDINICCGHNDVSTFGSILFDEIENIATRSTFSRIAALSISNNTYKFCRTDCFFIENVKPKNPNMLLERKQYKMLNMEEICLALSYDGTCNLRCAMCRKENISSPADLEITKHIHEEVLRIVSTRSTIITTNNGEVFFSPLLREVVFEKNNNDTIMLITNGQLFNEKNWQLLKSKYKRINITFSVDAACKETYMKIRGSNWDVLISNLQFASQLKQKGELNTMHLAFVVQKENFKEMPNFVKMAKELKVDTVVFCELVNKGIYTHDEFVERRVTDPGSRFYADYCAVIDDPLLNRDNVMFLGGDGRKNCLPSDYKNLFYV